MNKVEKIKAEIERRYEYWKEKESNSHSIESESRMSECQYLLLLFDSLQEDPVSNDLEEAATKYARKHLSNPDYPTYNDEYEMECAFEAGAQWQQEQMMKNSTFINEVEWGDDIHKLFREKGKKVKLTIIKDENY